jgi:hypothetical protein
MQFHLGVPENQRIWWRKQSARNRVSETDSWSSYPDTVIESFPDELAVIHCSAETTVSELIQGLQHLIHKGWTSMGDVGFIVLTPVVMSSGIYRCVVRWKSNLRVGWTCRLHLQDRRIIHARTESESTALSHWFALVAVALLVLRHWWWKRFCLSETSVDFERNTGRYIPEDRIIQVSEPITLCI